VLLARGGGDEVTVVPPGDEAERLAGYPVAALALGAMRLSDLKAALRRQR
jgi:hypothetical protein